MKTIKKELEILNTPLTKSELSQAITGTWKNVTRNQTIKIDKEVGESVKYYWDDCTNRIYNYSTPKTRLLRCYTKID